MITLLLTSKPPERLLSPQLHGCVGIRQVISLFQGMSQEWKDTGTTVSLRHEFYKRWSEQKMQAIKPSLAGYDMSFSGEKDLTQF